MSDSEFAVEASVHADLAVLTRLEGPIPAHLEHIQEPEHLPDLGSSLVNIYGPLQKTEFAQRLKEIIQLSFSASSYRMGAIPSQRAGARKSHHCETAAIPT